MLNIEENTNQVFIDDMLLIACEMNNTGMARLCINAGANLSESYGKAVIRCVSSKSPDVLKLLIKNGAEFREALDLLSPRGFYCLTETDAKTASLFIDTYVSDKQADFLLKYNESPERYCKYRRTLPEEVIYLLEHKKEESWE